MCDKGFYMFKNKCSLWCCLVIGFIVLAGVAVAEGSEKKDLLFVQDNIGDDKGPGYYQYPLDKRLKRGTFDIKSFKVTDDGDIVTFEIQMRNYIMREWPDSKKTGYQDFVANLWDIYIDIDGIPNSGYKYALPGRDLNFADNMGWEKMILVSPISEIELEEILNDKIDELEFQEQIPDILFPEYVKIIRDRVIMRISKKKLPRISERSGFQVFAMGYKDLVSPNRLINRDVKSFATLDDFGGGSDYYGDPTVIDLIMPKGCDQYDFLKRHKAQPFRENILYAEVPFVYKDNERKSPVVAAMERHKQHLGSPVPVALPNVVPTPGSALMPKPVVPESKLQIKYVPIPVPVKPAGAEPGGFVPLKGERELNVAPPVVGTATGSSFMPLKKP
ncbi:hypothetical protein EOM81_08535 [bacterium]|nr:hypothetical protein [bacterium]